MNLLENYDGWAFQSRECLWIHGKKLLLKKKKKIHKTADKHSSSTSCKQCQSAGRSKWSVSCMHMCSRGHGYLCAPQTNNVHVQFQLSETLEKESKDSKFVSEPFLTTIKPILSILAIDGEKQNNRGKCASKWWWTSNIIWDRDLYNFKNHIHSSPSRLLGFGGKLWDSKRQN